MTKKIRYTIILIGALFFIIFAPLIIIYVRGLRFNFDTKSFSHTGVLSVSSEPSSAEIFLDSELARKSAGTIRFLLPKEYLVSLKKDGYFDWAKRLPIKEDQVTWANNKVDKIYLFKNKPENKQLAEQVRDFFLNNRNLIYVTDSFLVEQNPFNSNIITRTPLPEDLKNRGLNLKFSKNARYALIIASATETEGTALNKAFLLDLNSNNFTDVSGWLSKGSFAEVDSGGRIFSLENQNLFNINTQTKQKTLLAGNVQSFSIAENGLYYLSAFATTSDLSLLDTSSLENQVVANNLPLLTQPKLLITNGKQIFIVSNRILYGINNPLESLATGVNSWQFDASEPSLTYTNFNELNYFDFGLQTPELITRTTENIGNFRLNQKVGYVFFASQNQITAFELDSRDRQNQYTLFQKQNIQKFEIDDEAKNLLVLSSGMLELVNIR